MKMKYCKSVALVIAGVLSLSSCASMGEMFGGMSGLFGGKESSNQELAEFFEEYFQAVLERSPESKTYLGITEDNDQWDDVSEEYQRQTLEISKAAMVEMQSRFDRETLNKTDQLSYDLFIYEIEKDIASYAFHDHRYSFNQMFGRQSSIPSMLINMHRIGNVEDAKAYIARLQKVPDNLEQHLDNVRRAAGKGIRPPRFVYDYVLDDANNVISGAPFDNSGKDSPLWADFSKKVNALDIPASQKKDLLKQGRQAMSKNVHAGYKTLIAYMKADKKLADDRDGVWKLPDGAAFYKERLKARTSTDMTADEIHAYGLADVARIHDEMRVIMRKVGFEGSLPEFFVFMRHDSQFYFDETDAGRDAYLQQTKLHLHEMQKALPSVFNILPKADLDIRRVEAFREKSAGKAFYNRPAPDGSRPGIYYVNLSQMSEMPSYQLEALAFHEASPGHHMQISIAQELKNLPKFRKYGNYTAYIEGWGLYSEYLPKEMGFYKDPYSDFGRLAMELWRSARLVVDTGLHHLRWTREQATQYLIDNTPNPKGDCGKAIDRYIVMPGQATAYKIGMMRILKLREQARAMLGSEFSLSEFHDIVLGQGSMPLSSLEARIHDWVAAKKSG